MKIATWNVNGLRARHAQLVAWVAAEQPDILCLQEIKATPDQIPDPLTTLVEYWNYWHGGPKGYSGVSLHVRRALASSAPTFTHPAFDDEYRMVEAVIDGVRYASVYVPNGGKDFAAKMTFLEQLGAWSAERRAAGENVILCGDLNVALTPADVHPTEQKRGTIGQRADERAALRRVIDHDLADVLRERHPDATDLFTWWAPWRNMREKNIGWRIDFILASAALAARVTRCEVRKEVLGSDHAPVVVEIA